MCRFLFIIVLIVVAMVRPVEAQVSSQPEPLYEVVVELKPDQSPTLYAPFFLSQLGVDSTEQPKRLNHIYLYAITGFSVFLTEDEIAKADRLFGNRSEFGIKSITLSRQVRVPVLTIDGLMPESPIRGNSQIIPTGIRRVNASLTSTQWDLGAVDVAVIDTGVDARHPDLNVVDGYDCTVKRTEEQHWDRDHFGHGTHVAGIIAARNNDIGVAGVAPGARIWSVKVLGDDGYGTTASVICGIDFIVKHADEIEVANMSLGGDGYKTACGESDPMHNAICVASEKIAVVVAAGNETADVSSSSPANYPEAVTVSALADFDGQPGGAGLAYENRCSAMSVDDELATFSNYGQGVDIAAPGTCILSTLPGSPDKDGVYRPAYGYASGTSMAAPHVAGAIARYLALYPDQRAYAVQQVLLWSKEHEQLMNGDHDPVPEPVLYVGNGAPRYERGPADPPGS